MEKSMETVGYNQQSAEISPYRVSPASDKFWPAWVKALGSIQSAAKDAKNPQYNSRYANLTACDEAVRPHLTDNKLAYMQFPVTNKQSGTVKTTTMVVHESGQFLEWDLELPVADLSTPQKAGSGITYVRRYAFAGFGLVADEDDDGNAASTPSAKQQAYPERQPAKQQPKPQAAATAQAKPVDQEGPPRPQPVNQQQAVQSEAKANDEIWSPELFDLLNKIVVARGYEKNVNALTQFLERGLLNPANAIPSEDRLAYMGMMAYNSDDKTKLEDRVKAMDILRSTNKLSGGRPLADVVKEVLELGPTKWLDTKAVN